LNGSPNFSILDGWWVEGYNGSNGWAIGNVEAEYDSEEARNHADAMSLYEILENEIVPAFYERDSAGIPRKWIKLVKESIRTIAPQFSMTRMIKEYTTKLYVPGME
jgi:starch phosphorylase